jgi:K+ transporter
MIKFTWAGIHLDPRGLSSVSYLMIHTGVAVMSVMVMTTLLMSLVMLLAWDINPLLVGLFLLVYLPMEGAFLSATLVKIPSGGGY